MTVPDIDALVRAHLRARWTGCVIAYPNKGVFRPANPTDESYFEPTSADTWIYVEVMPTGTDGTIIGSAGKRLARERGLIWCHAFVPVGTGDAEAKRLCRSFGDLFRLHRLGGGLIAEHPNPPGVGEPGDDEGSWWRVSVSIPFTATYAI